MYKLVFETLQNISQIVASMNRFGIEFNIVKIEQFDVDDVDNVDVIISAGGDGTFLRAASHIRSPVPMIGINLDPRRRLVYIIL